MFKKKQVYVNEKKQKPNIVIVGITMLIIGITWTSNWFLFQDLQNDYNRAIEIIGDAGMVSAVKEVTTTQTEEITEIDTPPVAGTVEEQIRKIATKNNADGDLLVRIAFCESSLNPKAKNNHSSATGLYQYLDDTWEEGVRLTNNDWTLEDRTDIEKSTRMIIWHINNGQLSKWEASEHCWKG